MSGSRAPRWSVEPGSVPLIFEASGLRKTFRLGAITIVDPREPVDAASASCPARDAGAESVNTPRVE